MAGGELDYSTASGALGEKKRKGETPAGESGINYALSSSVFWSQK